MIRKIISFSFRIILSIILLAILAAALSSFSPIFNFSGPKPFQGPDIFNPYNALSTCDASWKRANFHTHTRVDGLFNECSEYPGAVDSAYRSLGYDILTFSNHNSITRHPYSDSLYVSVYEHGYNLFKYHKLVFGADRVWHFDNLLPILASQRQWQLDKLCSEADIVQLNHPLRTNCTTADIMGKLSGYRLIELDSGISTGQEYWDCALENGHYSFGLAGDDCHDIHTTWKIACRCNFLWCRSAKYEDILSSLRSGCFYSMRVPDFGNGDWEIKKACGNKLPQVVNIGARKDTLFVVLDHCADSIVVTGSGSRTLKTATSCDSLNYVLPFSEPYARFTAFFPDGTVAYFNPFARYDASEAESPFQLAHHSVNWPLTVIFNLLLLAVAAICIVAIVMLFAGRLPLSSGR